MDTSTKNEAKHTAGPWNIRGHSRRFEIVGTTPAGDTDPLAICENIGRNNDANARLIAAAPCLLAACKRLIEDADDRDETHDEDTGEEYDDWKQLRAAIARAEGR